MIGEDGDVRPSEYGDDVGSNAGDGMVEMGERKPVKMNDPREPSEEEKTARDHPSAVQKLVPALR